MAQKYLAEIDDNVKNSRVAILKIEHLYYKHDSFYSNVRQKLREQKKEAKDLYLLDDHSS